MSLVLRDYQQIAVDNSLRDLAIHNKIALIMPTGAGKTQVFIEIAKKFLEENPSKSVVVISHLSILTDQTIERFKNFSKLNVGILQGTQKPKSFDQVIVSTMQSFSKEKKITFLKEYFLRKVGLIIVDEAHYLMTKSYDKCLSFFPEAKVIGVTATPFRKNKLMCNFFEKVSYSLSLQELIDQNFLVKPNIIKIERDSDDLESIMAFTVKTYKQYEDGNSAIIYMRTVEEAKSIRNCFQEIGIKAECLSFDMPKELRNEFIRRFNSGDIKVLSSVDVLSAGFDSPVVRSIFMPYGTRSVTKYMQRIGRGLRIDSGTGKSFCNVYIYGADPRIQSGFYERINNLALNANGKVKDYDTFKEEIDYNDFEPGSQRYEYTSVICDTIKKMESLGCSELASMLNHKEFPKRFMDKIGLLNKRLPEKILHRVSKAKPTDKQKQLLTSYSFTKDQLTKINKYEASVMIEAIIGKSNDGYTIQEGRFKGYHVSQIPFNYRNAVLEKYPESSIASLIKSWQSRGKTA